MAIPARRAARDRRGVAAVEFAVAAPFLMLVLLGFSDVVQMGRGHLRVQSAATQIGQIVSQCRQVSKGDEAQLVKLAESILGNVTQGGGWSVVITAIGRDAQDKPFTWSMPPAPPPSAAQSKGSEVPPGLDLRRDQVVFRTDVFAQVKTTFLYRTGNASGSALHMTRAPSADGLKAQKADAQLDCLKEVS